MCGHLAGLVCAESKAEFVEERAVRRLIPRDGASSFRDPIGRLDVRNVECDKCGRKGRYRLDWLIARYGIDAKLFEWTDDITPDCPRTVPRSAEGGVSPPIVGIAPSHWAPLARVLCRPGRPAALEVDVGILAIAAYVALNLLW